MPSIATVTVSVRRLRLLKLLCVALRWPVRIRLVPPRFAVWCVNLALQRAQFRIGEGKWRPLDLPRVRWTDA